MSRLSNLAAGSRAGCLPDYLMGVNTRAIKKSFCSAHSRARSALECAEQNDFLIALVAPGSGRDECRPSHTLLSLQDSDVHLALGATDNVNQNVEPSPGLLSTPTWPPWRSIMVRLICKPKPNPTPARVLAWVPGIR